MIEVSSGVSLGLLLDQSQDLENEIAALFEGSLPSLDRRVELIRTLSSLSLEHAAALRHLIAGGMTTTAMAVLRLQFEAVVRALWLNFGADQTWVDKLSAQLRVESDDATGKIPLVADMLKQMEGKAPSDAIAMLRQFSDGAYRATSSFIHGGIHAVRRHAEGAPLQLLENNIRNSNGLMVMAGMMVVVVSGNVGFSGLIPSLQLQYADCLPPVWGS